MNRNERQTASGSGNGDDQDAAEVPEKDDVSQRDEDDFFDQTRIAESRPHAGSASCGHRKDDVNTLRQT